MTNNDVLRHLRHILNVNDSKLIEIAALDGCEILEDEIQAYLCQDDEDGYEECPDEVLAHFLNGMIFYKRGRNPDLPEPKLAQSERRITNNIVLKKTRVAFALKDTDIVAKIEKSGLRVTKAEVNAFFRSPDHRNYRECLDQFLRNFFKGLSL